MWQQRIENAAVPYVLEEELSCLFLLLPYFPPSLSGTLLDFRPIPECTCTTVVQLLQLLLLLRVSWEWRVPTAVYVPTALVLATSVLILFFQNASLLAQITVAPTWPKKGLKRQLKTQAYYFFLLIIPLKYIFQSTSCQNSWIFVLSSKAFRQESRAVAAVLSWKLEYNLSVCYLTLLFFKSNSSLLLKA